MECGRIGRNGVNVVKRAPLVFKYVLGDVTIPLLMEQDSIVLDHHRNTEPATSKLVKLQDGEKLRRFPSSTLMDSSTN